MSASPRVPQQIGAAKYAFLTNSETGIIAHAGGGQANAYALSAQVSRVDTVATTGDSVRLPKILAQQRGILSSVGAGLGTMLFVHNNTTNALQLFSSGADTINGSPATTGIQIAAQSGVWLVPESYTKSTDSGTWCAVVTTTIPVFQQTVFNFMTPAQVADVQARTLTLDVSAALLAAFAAGVYKMPAGSYRCDSALVSATADDWIITGDGSGITILHFPNAAAAGVSLTYSDVTKAPSAHGLCLEVVGNSAAKALAITGPAGVLTTYIEGPEIEDVVIRPANAATDTWAEGLALSNVWYPRIVDLVVLGGIAITDPYTMLYGVHATNVQGLFADSLYVQHVVKAFFEDGTSLGEGYEIRTFEFVGVNTGIDIGSGVSTAIPGVAFGPGHINAALRGINIANRVQTKFTGLNIYKTQGTSLAFVGAVLAGCFSCEVSACFFGGTNQAGTGNGDGLYFTGTSADNTAWGLTSDYFTAPGTLVLIANTANNNFVDVDSCTIAATGGAPVVALTPIAVTSTGANNRIRSERSDITVLAANSATPSVDNALSGNFQTANTLATTITNFTGGYLGQVIRILVNDANTTLQHNGTTIVMAAQANRLCKAGDIYAFRNYGGTPNLWRQVGEAAETNALIRGGSITGITTLQAFASANSLQIPSTVRNDQAGTGVAAFGLDVTSSSSAETPAAKAGFGLQRAAAQGVGPLIFYNRVATDTSPFTAADEIFRVDVNQNLLMAAHRHELKQGAAIASANNLSLGADGNRFQVSGTTTINLIDSTNWQGGSIVTLHFQGVLTLTNNAAPSGAFKPIITKTGANVTTTAKQQVVLQYDSTDSVWYQVV